MNPIRADTEKQYALEGNLTAGIQHGSWTMPMEAGKAPKPSWLNSNAQHVLEDLQYTKEDIKHVEDWVKRTSSPHLPPSPIEPPPHFTTHRTDN